MSLDIRLIAGEQVELRRNPRRRRNAAAHRENGRAVVELPPFVPVSEEQRWLETMIARLHKHEKRHREGRSDAQLFDRALILHRTHLAPALAVAPTPRSVVWADNMARRWGSCTPSARTIRLSSRLRDFPQWVIDYVLLHELAHLIEPGHGPAFQALLEAYPRTQEAKGYLEGYTAGQAAREGASAAGRAAEPGLCDLDENRD